MNEHDQPDAAREEDNREVYRTNNVCYIYINGIAKATQMWPSMAFYVCYWVTPYGNNRKLNIIIFSNP